MNGNQERRGDIPLSLGSKIAAFRGLNKEQKEQLFSFVSKNDIDGYKVTLIASLVKQGKSIKDALKEVDDYKTISCKFFVRKNIYENALKENDNKSINLLIKALNNAYPNIALAIVSKSHN